MYKYLFFICFILFSCKKENWCDCVKSTGSDSETYRNIIDFSCIDAKDKMDVYLTQGPNFEVKVKAGKNLQNLIKTELDGETLKVFNNNKCNWVRGYKHKISIYITAPYFKYIKNEGLGTIKSTNTITQNEISLRVENSGDVKLDVDANTVICSTHGNGDVYLSGKTLNLQSDYTGTNYLFATDLEVKNYIYLHSVSIGHAHINAPENGLMDIQIDRSGNIYYKGNPTTINLKRKGEGNLILE
jgi:hypothetical protein